MLELGCGSGSYAFEREMDYMPLVREKAAEYVSRQDRLRNARSGAAFFKLTPASP
jgi:hypothetical protein